MAAAVAPYDEWLCKKLLSFNEDIDAEIFVSYIVGILDEDTSADEKRQSLVEFLAGIMEADQERACEEIMAEWERTHAPSVAPDTGAVKDMGDRLAELMVSQQLPTMKERQMTEEEKERKAAILAQYAEVSEGESDDEDAEPGGAKAGAAAPAAAGGAGAAGGGASASSSGSGGRGTLTDANLLMFKNTNASDVKHREQEQQEKSKQEAEKKKEKDKADREAQRQKQQERKEAEKKRTQKGERRR